MSEIRVLVADHRDLFRVGLASLLAAVADIDVVGQASSGPLAVRLAHDVDPDVVLLALSLPDAGASAATSQIVAEHSGVRVIVLAGRETESDIRAVLSAGACGYLPRDSSFEEIVAAIRAAASGHAWRSPEAPGAGLGRPQLDEDLSPRELEVLGLLRRGQTTGAIAKRLDISPVAVRGVISSIVHKTDPPSGGFRHTGGQDPEGSGGVRDPRRPRPETGSGSARLQPPQR